MAKQKPLPYQVWGDPKDPSGWLFIVNVYGSRVCCSQWAEQSPDLVWFTREKWDAYTNSLNIQRVDCFDEVDCSETDGAPVPCPCPLTTEDRFGITLEKMCQMLERMDCELQAMRKPPGMPQKAAEAPGGVDAACGTPEAFSKHVGGLETRLKSLEEVVNGLLGDRDALRGRLLLLEHPPVIECEYKPWQVWVNHQVLKENKIDVLRIVQKVWKKDELLMVTYLYISPSAVEQYLVDVSEFSHLIGSLELVEMPAPIISQ